MKGWYTKSFIISCLLHGAVIGFLTFSWSSKSVIPAMALPAAPIEPKETIRAISINESQLNEEIARLENIEKEKVRAEKAKREKELARKRQIERERKAAIEKRKAEEKRLAKLKAEKARLAEEAKALEAAKLEAKKQREKELKEAQDALAKLKKEKEAAEKAKAKALEEKKKAEALAKKQEEERKKREAKALAEKKRLEAAERARAQRVTQDQIAQYAGIIQAKIHQNWRQPLGVELAGKRCVLSVRLAASGEVLEANVVESSGNLEFDRSSELAVMKSSPLPLPSDDNARSQFKKFTFTFNPEAV